MENKKEEIEGDNIKKITLGTKPAYSNNDSNDGNIIFGNNENINKFLSNNENIVIQEEIVANVDSKPEDDFIYLQELENQLLSEYPVTKQNVLFIQKNVEQQAKRILEVKNIGVQNYELFEKGITYPILNEILNDKFFSKWIIPIVLDKHRIYAKLKEDDEDNENINNSNSNIYFTETLENKEGILEENQKIQLSAVKELGHNYVLGKINLKNYLNQVNNLTKPYLPKYGSGYVRKPKNDALVLRLYDYDNIYWNDRLTQKDYNVSYDVRDEKSRKITGIKESTMIEGEDINIVGFLILPNLGYQTETNYNLTKKYDLVGNITKIFQSGDFIHIEIDNHGLEEGDIIFIENSNSFPNINATFSKSLKVIDKNLISIASNKKIEIEGNFGQIYVLSKLKYDMFLLDKNDLTFKFNKSLYKNNENPEEHNKIYLFDKHIIKSKSEYDNILKKIIPNIEQIINNEMPKIKDAFTFENINNILSAYNITINDITISEIIKIKNILEANLIKFEENNLQKNKLNPKASFAVANKYFNNNENYFLSNKFITNKDIEKYYGVYMYLNKPEDNLLLRLEWIQSQNDYGDLYYQYLLLDIKKSLKLIDQKNIKDKIKMYNELYSKIEKNYEKEVAIDKKNKKCKYYRFQPYKISQYDIDTDFEDIKKWDYDNITVFYDNNIFWWKNKKMVKMENIEEDTLALVKSSDHITPQEVWIYKDNVWTKTSIVPEYDNIKYLCYLNNIDLKNIKLDTLDCIYRKETGCGSKLILRYEENLKILKEHIDKFEKLEDYYKNDNYLKNIESNIEKIIIKHFSFSDQKLPEELNKNKSDNAVINESPIIKTPIEKFVDAILNIQNDYVKLNMIYNLIDKDAIIIDKVLYSKKYKTKMGLCGHYLYFKKADYSTNADERTLVIENMLNIYSDNGQSKKNVNTCTVCGQELIFADYDETEGFSNSGMIKKSRETWIAENLVDEDITLDSLDFFKDIKVNCLDENFKKKLLSAGLSIEDTNEAIKICNFLTVNLSAKVGVKIPSQILINIIIDSMQKIKTFPPYEYYKAKEYKKFEEKGFSTLDVSKFEARFKEDYETIKTIRIYSIISSRFLIAIQTTIPQIVRSSEAAVDERCSFFSFDGEEGSSYMVCLLNEMNLVKKDKLSDRFKIKFDEAYNEFMDIIYIKELFKKKKSYDTQFKMKIEKKIINTKQDDNEIAEEKPEPEKLTIEYLNKLKTSKDIFEVRNIFNSLMNRLIFLAKKIKYTVKTVIAEQPSSDYTSVLENSCCTELADEYLGYYFFIIKNTEIPLKELMDDSWIDYDYLRYFVKSGTIHRCVFVNKYKFDGIYNPIIVDDDEHTSKSIIDSMFEIFVDTGFYAGTRRDYVKSLDSYIDIKTGLTKKQILEKNYNIKDYQELLKNIEKNTVLYFKEPVIYKFNETDLNKLKKLSNDKLNKIIKILINNISQVLNKNQDFSKKYEDLLFNFGLNIKKTNLMNEKDINKKRVSAYKKRYEYFTTFYISKIHKFLSIIQNDFHENQNSSNVNLNFIGKDSASEKIKIELQETIFNENAKLDYFLNPEVRKNFLELNMDYSNKEINGINGIDNIYDRDYDKILKKSDFNFFDASNVILFIIISNLNNWILYKKQDIEKIDENNIENIDYKSLKCKYICQFILLLLDEIYDDYEIFDLGENCTLNINNNFVHDIIESKYKLFMKEGDDDKFSLLMKSKMGQKSSLKTELEENQEKYDSQDILIDSENNDKDEYILEKGKKELTSLLGHEPNADELQSYKNKYLENMMEDNEEEMDNYDLDAGPKGAEVLDQGADYGTLNEYDFEDGEGFSYEPDGEEY